MYKVVYLKSTLVTEQDLHLSTTLTTFSLSCGLLTSILNVRVDKPNYMFWYDYSSPGLCRRIQNVQLLLHEAEINPRIEKLTCRFKIVLFILSKYQVSCLCWQWQNPLLRIWRCIYSHSSQHIHVVGGVLVFNKVFKYSILFAFNNSASWLF